MELAVATPLLLLLLLFVVQAAVWAHAAHVARAAAVQALDAARAEHSTAAAGRHAGATVLEQLGATVLTDAQITVTRDGDSVEVTVSGRAASVIPGLRPPVRVTLTGPVERFVPDTRGFRNPDHPAAPAVRWRGEAMRRSLRQGERGSAAVELTLVVPMLVVLLLFVVLVGRLAAAQMDVNAAAHAAARAASLERDTAAAAAQAQAVAEASLAERGLTCRDTATTVDAGGLRPGGAVRVTVRCVVSLSDLSLLRLPGTRIVTATGSSPIDTWRAKSLGFRNPERNPRNEGGGEGP